MLVNPKKLPVPIFAQIMKWREEHQREELLVPRQAKAIMDFEVTTRVKAMQMDPRDDCPYVRPDDVHKIPNMVGSGSTTRLGVLLYESFYLTKEQYEGDINYLKIIYDYYKLSDFKIGYGGSICGSRKWLKRIQTNLTRKYAYLQER